MTTPPEVHSIVSTIQFYTREPVARISIVTHEHDRDARGWMACVTGAWRGVRGKWDSEEAPGLTPIVRGTPYF